MKTSAFAPGKIILSGEYAVVFGYPGIAVPAPNGIMVTFEEDPSTKDLTVECTHPDFDHRWQEYLKHVLALCIKERGLLHGKLTVECDLPLGKGMGSSTSLVIAIVKCLLGDNSTAEESRDSSLREAALAIEDTVNPGHSGLDFTVIWENAPVLFQKGKDPQKIDLPKDILRDAMFIDTGTPNEQTPELIAWVEQRKEELQPSLEMIGNCTERLLKLTASAAAIHESQLREIVKDHHRAQAALGVISESVQSLIAGIENEEGAAKVLGAGAKIGGGGIVLAFHSNAKVLESIAKSHNMPILKP